MNGTSMMTGLACLAFRRAQKLARLASALSAVACEVMRGNPSHFDERLFALKPHPGPATCARWIRDDLEYGRIGRAARSDTPPAASRIGTRSAARRTSSACWWTRWRSFRPLLETEVNSVNDNPDRRCGGRRDLARRKFLRRPRGVRDGRPEDGRGQRGRPARSTAGPAVQPGDQQWSARRIWWGLPSARARRITDSRPCRSPPRP